jgi:hypothetical protein
VIVYILGHPELGAMSEKVLQLSKAGGRRVRGVASLSRRSYLCFITLLLSAARGVGVLAFT